METLRNGGSAAGHRLPVTHDLADCGPAAHHCGGRTQRVHVHKRHTCASSLCHLPFDALSVRPLSLVSEVLTSRNVFLQPISELKSPSFGFCACCARNPSFRNLPLVMSQKISYKYNKQADGPGMWLFLDHLMKTFSPFYLNCARRDGK